MFNSFLFCSALNAVFTIPYLLVTIGYVRDGLEDKNIVYVLSSLANATSQALFAVALTAAAALHWTPWNAMALARGTLFCEAAFEVVEIAGAIDALYLQAWNGWIKLLLAGTWAVTSIGLMVTSFFLDNDGATGLMLFAFSIVANYEIKMHWASRTIPKLEAQGQRKPRRGNAMDADSDLPASEILHLESLRTFVYVIITLLTTMPMFFFLDKWPLFYTLQILIVNMLLAFGNISGRLLSQWPCGRQLLDLDGDDYSSGSEEPDIPPELLHRYSGVLY
ncbi:uncharacterized protein Z520_12283 [Fonsecaea multimorphosa CBS 102226]|uniref:Uncharacterized protein n=1 Tax=Fonsecaea multimorphosa CBS 102226 TaxID=1442371 RepID=A0A0D2JFR6_9EURO|nr:uncharacterized protein Z520_12283 [Fonsecaea multimorphosa CBS 102226]KIX92012.1 hypothetical protein Z520_12283 [Fonsecaea multimorphosa CBS 102226]OAL17369.1 hypothetical protein AYO22_11736 [Fonsecaea multimorphosa]